MKIRFVAGVRLSILWWNLDMRDARALPDDRVEVGQQRLLADACLPSACLPSACGASALRPACAADTESTM